MELDFVTYCNSALKSKQIELRPLQHCTDLWTEVSLKLPYQPGRYVEDVVNYYRLHFQSQFDLAHDQSVVILANNAPIGIWPLMVAKKDATDRLEFMTHGEPILPPLFIKDYPHRASNRLQHKLYDLIHDFGKLNSFNSPLFADIFTGQIGISEWYAQTIQVAEKSSSNHIQYTHLEQGMPFVESHIRKAYKPLINGAKKKFSTSIVDASNPQDFLLYKELHHFVSGRITRVEATWNAQLTLIKKGHGFCVLIYHDDEVVGAAYFTMTSDEAAYFSGAYKRDYAKEPLGHLTLYTALEHAVKQDLKWLRIGLLRQNKEQKLTDIDFFKNGFATHIIIENQTNT